MEGKTRLNRRAAPLDVWNPPQTLAGFLPENSSRIVYACGLLNFNSSDAQRFRRPVLGDRGVPPDVLRVNCTEVPPLVSHVKEMTGIRVGS